MENKNEMPLQPETSLQTNKECNDSVKHNQELDMYRIRLYNAHKELKKKDDEIASLTAKLQKKDVTIVTVTNQIIEMDATIARLTEDLKRKEVEFKMQTSMLEMTRIFLQQESSSDAEENLRSPGDDNNGQTSTSEECVSSPFEASNSSSDNPAREDTEPVDGAALQKRIKYLEEKLESLEQEIAVYKLLHETASADTCVPSSCRTSVCPNVAGESGHLAKKQMLGCKMGKCGNIATSTSDTCMQVCCSPHLHLDQLEFDEKDSLLKDENRKLGQDKYSKLKQELPVIDFDALSEIPEGIYNKVNDIKTRSACPCLCLAVLLNKLLVDRGHPPWFDSTLTIELLSIITKKEESLLRQLFCSPETEEGADAFNVLFDLGVIEIMGKPRRFEKFVQREHLKMVLEGIVNDKLPDQGKEKEKHCFFLGLGYVRERGTVGHCINIFVKNNKLVPVDAQNDGYCQLDIFDGVNDIRVFRIAEEFESSFSSCLRHEKLSKTDLVEILKKTFENFTQEKLR